MEKVSREHPKKSVRNFLTLFDFLVILEPKNAPKYLPPSLTAKYIIPTTPKGITLTAPALVNRLERFSDIPERTKNNNKSGGLK